MVVEQLDRPCNTVYAIHAGRRDLLSTCYQSLAVVYADCLAVDRRRGKHLHARTARVATPLYESVVADDDIAATPAIKRIAVIVGGFDDVSISVQNGSHVVTADQIIVVRPAVDDVGSLSSQHDVLVALSCQQGSDTARNPVVATDANGEARIVIVIVLGVD